MRLLIAGSLGGQLTLATKIAIDRGAKVVHVADIDQAMAALRSGAGADLVMTTRGPDGATPLCRVTLAQAAAGEGLAVLAPDDDCGEAIRVLELAGWKLDGEVLSVHDASGRLRLSFTQQDGPVWIRNPEGSRPLFFIRGE